MKQWPRISSRYDPRQDSQSAVRPCVTISVAISWLEWLAVAKSISIILLLLSTKQPSCRTLFLTATVAPVSLRSASISTFYGDRRKKEKITGHDRISVKSHLPLYRTKLCSFVIIKLGCFMLHDIYCKTYPVAHVKPFPLERARKNLMVKHEHDSIVLYAKKKN